MDNSLDIEKQYQEIDINGTSTAPFPDEERRSENYFQVEKKQSVKQILMSRSTTSDNNNHDNIVQGSIGGSSMNPILVNSSLTNSIVQRADSGVEVATPVTNSSNLFTTNDLMPPNSSSDKYSSSQVGFDIHISSQYHNRQQSNVYSNIPPLNAVGLGASTPINNTNAQATLSTQNLKSSGNNILVNAGQYASQSIGGSSIPIRNGANTQLLMQGSNVQQRGPSQQGIQQQQQNTSSSNNPNQSISTLSQQQIQQQQYKTAKTQMYEKMLIQQQQQLVDKKAMMFASTVGGSNGMLNQSQLAAAQALSQQHHFLNQAITNSQQQQQQQQQASLLFPRIGNIRNENTTGSMYKTPTSMNPQINQQQTLLGISNQPNQQNSVLSSPFMQTQKNNQIAIQNGLLVTNTGPSSFQSSSTQSQQQQKKKTVSPRNNAAASSAFQQAKMLVLADKNNLQQQQYQSENNTAQGGKPNVEEYAMSLLEQSNSKNRNRLKSNNNYKGAASINEDQQQQFEGGRGNKEYYQTEKFGQHLLMNSDSHTALAVAKLQGEENPQQQFFCGEMSINNNGIGRMTSEEAANLYNQAMTPSIMSSHSNKRQSHHLQNNQPQMDQSQSSSHNFFSRRTVSNKDGGSIVSNLKQPIQPPVSGSHILLQQQQLQQQQQPDQFTQSNYPFSPMASNQQYNRGGMLVDGNAYEPSRTKFTGSVNGMRASHDSSPVKNSHHQVDQNTAGDTTSTSQVAQDQANQQQAVKIPVICGFHKRVLLLTSQITNSQGQVAPNQPGFNNPLIGVGGQGGLPGTGPLTAQQQRESINKKIRNRNPNCNHNNNSVFYAPCYNNVKYDDSYKKKEEVLRKVFFKECAREDEKRTITQQSYYPNTSASTSFSQKSNDPFTYLKPIENFLISTLFVDYDIQQAQKQNPHMIIPRPNTNSSTLFLELGLEQAIVAHKAFLLALIQSGKITTENMLKVLHEFKSSALEFDHECIYCKYSQYALRESTKVIRNTIKAAAITDGSPSHLEGDNHNNPIMSIPPDSNGQDPRIEYLIRMFQSQLFKRSFINTSLMIIQRKMNEKLLQKQRLPPGINQNQAQANQDPNAANGKAKKPIKNDKKVNAAPMSSLDWIGQQMQKLAKNLSNPKDKDKYLELKEKYYKEFLLKILQSNNAIIPFPKTHFTPYKYYIGKGNNSILVRNCLKARFWWSMGDFEEWDEYNFIWTQWKTNKIIAKIKNNQEVVTTEANSNKSSGLSTKEKGIIGGSDSMLSTDRDSNSSAETLLATPTKRKRVATALLSTQQSASLPIKKVTATSSASKTNVIPAKGGAALPGGATEEKKETSHSMITYNHMENNYHLSNKKALYYNMKIYYESIGQDWFSVLPLTFHIKEGPSDKEFQRFTEIFKDYDSAGKANLGNFEKLGKQIWIVKPGENTNRGCGIQVCRELPQIKEIVSNTNVNGQKRSYIIQKYIEKPLLYKNRKFDIRTYTLLTTINGNLQGYWYNEGYLRTSSKDFNLKNVTNRLIHLTNDAVQKKSDDYGKFESGNKLSYPDFQKYLDSIDVKCNFVKEIVPQLKKMATDTIKACSRKIDPQRRHNTFEIFGYDFMIDEDMKPWLIEVNTNPCLELSAPYLSRLIPSMVENAVKIAVDPLFPPPPWPNAKKHTIPDCMENNKFELVFNELTDGPELKNLPIDDGALNGIIEEEEMEDEGDEEGDEEDLN